MEILPFVLNKTRLVVISDQVVQITLSSKNSSSESLYNHNQLMQDEIKKVVVAFVKLKEENLIVDGNGYKKHSWQYGRKYIFFKNKSRLKVHRYKYTFELEPLKTDHEESTSSHIGKNKSVQQQQQKDGHESNLPQITDVFSNSDNSDAINTSFLSEGDVVGVEATPNRSRTQLTVREISEISKSTAASSIQLAKINKDSVDQSVRETNAHTEDYPVQSDSNVESSNGILSVSEITTTATEVISNSHSSSTNNKREVSNEFSSSDSAEGSTSLKAVSVSESNLGKRKERSDDDNYSFLNPFGFIKRMFGGDRRRIS